MTEQGCQAPRTNLHADRIDTMEFPAIASLLIHDRLEIGCRLITLPPLGLD